MLQLCVALKIVVANRLMQHHLKTVRSLRRRYFNETNRSQLNELSKILLLFIYLLF